MSRISIFIGGQLLSDWEDCTITRSKAAATGYLSVTVLIGPETLSTISGVKPNVSVVAYVGNSLAFTGELDSRTDTFSATSYSVALSARGKAKRIVDSSHQHKTGSMLKPTTHTAIKEIVKPSGIKVDVSRATAHKLEKVRFRDGGIIADEVFRLARDNAHFWWEGRAGQLIISDDHLGITGVSFSMGAGGKDNILSGTAEQTVAHQKSQIKVKGHRTDKKIRGRASVKPTVATFDTPSTENAFSPIVVHHSGDGTPEALKRRAHHEANIRNANSKKVSLVVFDVINPSTGSFYDIGQLHHVVLPLAGVDEVLECTGLTYSAKNKDECQTSLTLSPPPTKGSGSSSKSSSSSKSGSKWSSTKLTPTKSDVPATTPRLEAGIPDTLPPGTNIA